MHACFIATLVVEAEGEISTKGNSRACGRLKEEPFRIRTKEGSHLSCKRRLQRWQHVLPLCNWAFSSEASLLCCFSFLHQHSLISCCVGAMGGAGLLVKEEPPISSDTGNGTFSPQKKPRNELLSSRKKSRGMFASDAGFTKDAVGDGHAGLPLNFFLDLAERQTSIEPAAKRMKLCATRPKVFDVESMMKHVADIVLVLAGLGLIRAGRDPTQEERRLQAEAYGHLGFLVQELGPRDLVSQDAVENLIEDLGLRKPEGQEVKTFEQILEEFQPPAVDPAGVGMGTSTTERTMDDSDPHKFLLSASRFLHGANDSSDQSELTSQGGLLQLEGEVSPSEQDGEAAGSHMQFTQAIHELLQPRYPPDYPFQPAHSRVFMTAAMPCEMCKVVARETASVLVCDTCEKVFHLRCLQSYLMTGIPKGDWQCPTCSSDNNKDKDQTSKYGRVKAGFSFSDANGISGKSPAKSPSNAQKTKQPATSSADGKINKEASGKVTSPPKQKLDDQAPESSKASQKILNHGNLGGSFTALLDSFSQGDSLKGGQATNTHEPTTHPQVQTTTRSAFLRSQVGQSPTMLPAKPQSQPPKGGKGAAKVVGKDLQSKKPLESQNVSSHPLDVSRAESGEKQSNSVEDSESLDETSAGSGEEADCEKVSKEPDRFGIEWVGDAVHRSDGKKFYSACTVGGYTYRLQDCALFRPETPNVPPYIARLQALWEDTNSGAKWVRVNWCYYPADMAMLPGRPSNPEVHEVYESNHGDNNLVGTIQGQCLVLQPESYAKEMERRQELLKGGNTGEGLVPIFLCRWLYDVATATFRPTAGAP
ncbi:hypothetical protein GOP47_0020608 [Adiantum capillus-veneris]|uniref:Uncharacterized protein n=1 Tax=Adiantum capillus-veneris TaxID=13818 RepID=A0A9D4Z686_ADICA|nr:hypothetical protein GOP47_0020608 [Adiantum capillus-veneris]